MTLSLWAVIILMMLGACVGRMDTKPALTGRCGIDWQEKSGIMNADLSDSSTNRTLHVLVFNIHDRLLPGSLFSSDAHTDEDVACIGDLASQYDLVLFQESFVRPSQLARYTGHAWADHPHFTEGGGGDWWPLRMMCEICLSPGLLMLAREHPKVVHAEPYEAFSGWNTDLNKADDFFSKGFQLVELPAFWVLNSHMDAGRGQESIEARALQFRQVTAALRRLVPIDAPLLVGMDANLRPDLEEQDRKVLEEFLQSNGLTLVHQNGPDLIAVRHVEVGHPRTLLLKGVLSDHNALSVILYPPSLFHSSSKSSKTIGLSPGN
ncbi:MAG: hypothetical protein WD425_17405 [Nitrospirales bacterium]